MFQFRLQPVLDYRKALEDQLMLEFADVKRRLDGERETLERMRSEMADLVSQLKTRGERKLSAPDVSFYLSYINYMRGEEKRQAEIVSRVGEELEEKRTELVEAAGKRKILEVMKEKQLKDYRISMTLREQKELDEASILRSVGGMKREEADTCL